MTWNLHLFSCPPALTESTIRFNTTGCNKSCFDHHRLLVMEWEVGVEAHLWLDFKYWPDLEALWTQRNLHQFSCPLLRPHRTKNSLKHNLFQQSLFRPRSPPFIGDEMRSWGPSQRQVDGLKLIEGSKPPNERFKRNVVSEIKVWERNIETKQGVETNRLLDIDRIGKEELGLKPILLKEAALKRG